MKTAATRVLLTRHYKPNGIYRSPDQGPHSPWFRIYGGTNLWMFRHRGLMATLFLSAPYMNDSIVGKKTVKPGRWHELWMRLGRFTTWRAMAGIQSSILRPFVRGLNPR